MTKHGQLNFRVDLPPEFPRAAPRLRLLVQATHPWVMPDLTIVGHPALKVWSPSFELGRVLAEIAAEFVRNPPAPVRNPVPVNVSPQPQVAQQHHQQAAQPSPSPSPSPPLNGGIPERQQSLDDFDVPPVPRNYDDELSALSGEDLQRLIDDDVHFEQFFHELPLVKGIEGARNDMRADVERTANLNLSYKEQVAALRARSTELRAALAERQAEHEQLVKRQEAILKRYSPDNLRMALQYAVAEGEEVSDELASKYRMEDLDLKTFVKEYIKARSLLHERSAKLERFEQQM